jgi:hypothetical protein
LRFSFFSLFLFHNLQNLFKQHNPTYGGLPSISTALILPSPIFLDLTAGERGAVTRQVCVTSSIVTIVRTTLTMLTATRANILIPNHRTTAIANHFLSLFLSLSSYIDIIQAIL